MAFAGNSGGWQRKRDDGSGDSLSHVASPGVYQGHNVGEWGVSWERMWRDRVALELRLQILLQDRHLDREAAIVREHHADEFVARMQVG